MCIFLKSRAETFEALENCGLWSSAPCALPKRASTYLDKENQTTMLLFEK